MSAHQLWMDGLRDEVIGDIVAHDEQRSQLRAVAAERVALEQRRGGTPDRAPRNAAALLTVAAALAAGLWVLGP